jgi:hypothetical protein
LYVFYERGETSPHAAKGRIVRIGNHPRTQDRLVPRLRDHYSPGKNGSVFRKFLGGALLRRESVAHPCLAPGPGKGHWEKRDATPCRKCQPLEEQVTVVLRTTLSFRCVAIEEQGLRNALERAIIGSLSQCSVCGPSAQWLGRCAYSEKVQSSGLWNSQHVFGPAMTSADIKVFERLVAKTVAQRGRPGRAAGP